MPEGTGFEMHGPGLFCESKALSFARKGGRASVCARVCVRERKRVDVKDGAVRQPYRFECNDHLRRGEKARMTDAHALTLRAHHHETSQAH